MFTKENLQKYVYGDFDDVDSIEGSDEMAPFLDSIIAQVWPELGGLSPEEMRSDNVVEDCLIGANPEDRWQVWMLAAAKFDEVTA